MKRILFRKTAVIVIFAILIFNVKVLAQGSWNIKYLPIDSLNGSYVGKEIRIDFKSFSTDTLNESPEWMERKLLSKEDTIKLIANGMCKSYKESWKLYPDHGVLSDQSLVCLDKHEWVQIREIYLVSISDNSIAIDFLAYDSKGLKKKQKSVLCKCDIKGILIKLD
jgi:hypothetical protein